MRIFISLIGMLTGAAIGGVLGVVASEFANDPGTTSGRYGLIASNFAWLAPMAGLGFGGLLGFTLSGMPFQSGEEKKEVNEYLRGIKQNPDEKMRLKLSVLELAREDGSLDAQMQEELSILRRFFELEPDMRKILRIADLEIRMATGEAAEDERVALGQWLEMYDGTRETIEVRMTLMLRDYRDRNIASEKELALLEELEAKFADR